MAKRTELEQHIRTMPVRSLKGIRTMAKGIKELKEALVLGFAVAGIVKEIVADGVQPSDALAFAEKLVAPEVVAKIQAAIEGAHLIGEEASDVDLFEGLELARFAIAEIKKLAA